MALLRQKKPIARIEQGQDEAGRPIMRIQEDQERHQELTGEYRKNPVIHPLPSMKDETIPIGTVWAKRGWFRPSDSFRKEVINYELSHMYKPDNRTSLGISGTIDTKDVGRLGVTIAELKTNRDGTVHLQLPKQLPKSLPGKHPDFVRNKQDAATILGANGKTESLNKVLGMVRAERGPITMETHQECDLRMVMHNQKIYENYDTVEETRKEGKRVLDEINDMCQASTFAKCVDDLNHVESGQQI